MAKIQARNVDEALYERIEASAMKHERSVEGEIRIALRNYYGRRPTPFRYRSASNGSSKQDCA